MKEGDVLLASLRQADGRIKNRPVVVLRRLPPLGDLLVCGVSSQLQQAVAGFDEIIGPQDEDFASSGLKTASVIRLGFLASLPPGDFVGRIGAISRQRHRRLLINLCDYLEPSETT